MAYVQQSPTIPSAFVKLDTRTTAELSFLNMRDLQVFRRNHNILSARRLRTPILTLSTVNNDDVNGAVVYGGARPANKLQGDVLIWAPIEVSPNTQDLVVVIRAASVASGSNLYPVVMARGSVSQIDSAVVLAITGTSDAKYSVDVPVPRAARERRNCDLMIFSSTPMQGADSVGATAIVDVGRNWVETAGSFSAGEIVYFANGSGLNNPEPRYAKHVYNVSSNQRVVVDLPFEIYPVAGTHTMASRDPDNISITSLCVYEKDVASF